MSRCFQTARTSKALATTGLMLSGLMLAGLMLAGCNTTQAPQPQMAQTQQAQPQAAVPTGLAQTYATERFAPAGFKLPDGAGCSGDVARFRAIMDNDWRSGNVGQGVYVQIQGEISQADAACSAGRDAEARGLIRASRARHGYPAG